MVALHSGFGLVLASLGLVSSIHKPTPGSIDISSPATGGSSEASIEDPECAPVAGYDTGKCVEVIRQGPLLASSTPVATSPVTPTTFSFSATRSNGTASHDTLDIQDTSDLCAVESYDFSMATPSFAPFNREQANIFRYRQQQGVNLGSWFVHEQWMTPSLFSCASGKKISELDIATGWGSPTSARALLERHWDTFITTDDFTYLASIGINTVRIPIGYWNLGPLYCQNTPFQSVSEVYQNSWPRIVKAINMAAEVGIGVLIDLHGAVGSQNGQPHSGISDGQTNLFSNPADQTQTLNVLTFLTQQLATVTNIVGIQLLNEPQNVPQLTDFYNRALTTLRQVSPQAESFPFYIHDGFDLERFSDFISARSDFVVQDHHSYFVFTPKDASESPEDHTRDIEGSIAESLAAASKKQRRNIVIDEWSCALTPQSLAASHNPEADRRGFCEGQMRVYQNNTAGWSFWSYLKEECTNDEGWCFKDAVGKTLPSTFFSYEGQEASTGVPSATALTDIRNMHVSDPTTILQRVTGSGNSNSIPALFAPLSIRTIPISKSVFRRDHRFVAVHSHSHSQRRGAAFTGMQNAIIQGYSNGYLTAREFASFGMSKLGFRGQYLGESLLAAGYTDGEDSASSGGMYAAAFEKGLEDGERMVQSIALVR